MNDFDQEKLDRLIDNPPSLYEKVLIEKDRMDRWREAQKERIEAKFDWFIRDAMGEFYDYKPWEVD